MSTNFRSLKNIINYIQENDLIDKVESQEGITEPSFSIPYNNPYNKEGQLSRLNIVKENVKSPIKHLEDNGSIDDLSVLKGNIENFIGFASVPIGLAGPLKVNGTAANGDYLVPLATTEGALVASYNRGCKAAYLSGGIRSVCLTESVQRSPLFKFNNIIELGKFMEWIASQWATFSTITESSSNYAKLLDLKTNVEGNNLNLVFEFSTGDAAGQNMVTFCSYAICEYILKNTPIKPIEWYVESNFSGDKKANYHSFQNVRGKKVVAELEVPREVVQRVLKSTPEKIEQYWKTSTVSLIQLGSIGAQGHIANGLTALFIATGQDVACISEVTVGVSRFEVTEKGNLYASLTLPNLIVGTVGGGTSLPTQKECLELMDCYGAGNARKFAEVCCALALAGELSIASAIASGHFVSAHKNLGR